MNDRIEYGKSWDEFCGDGLNKSGTVICVESELRETYGKVKECYMIGDINKPGGTCDDCKAFGNAAIVAWYKVLEGCEEEIKLMNKELESEKFVAF